ncbi:FHA domain-containing protein [Agromyces sp. Marseille-Q5079]|uniref:FHA domain-containing protein n=1 Tax=Agromyces sp. Marseille-Q5079 TaxID=3439059 RepID=UPI003D9C90D1
MAAPEFIVPPPGLIPNAPDETPSQTTDGVAGATDRTVQAAPVRPFPSFTPLPTAPPAAVAVPPAFQPPAPTPTATVFHLVGADGVEVELAERSVLGRRPAADEQHAGARPIALDDPTRTVSKTHAFVEVRDGRVVVTDLHSTNGVAVQAGGGELTVLDAGAPAEVEPGSVLRLGDLALTLRRSTGLTV